MSALLEVPAPGTPHQFNHESWISALTYFSNILDLKIHKYNTFLVEGTYYNIFHKACVFCVYTEREIFIYSASTPQNKLETKLYRELCLCLVSFFLRWLSGRHLLPCNGNRNLTGRIFLSNHLRRHAVAVHPTQLGQRCRLEVLVANEPLWPWGVGTGGIGGVQMGLIDGAAPVCRLELGRILHDH